MVCLVVVGNLKDLIDSVLLSTAMSREVLVNENIFEVMEFIENMLELKDLKMKWNMIMKRVVMR